MIREFIGGSEGRLRAVAAAAFLALAAVSLSGPQELVYDERYYVRVTVDVVHEFGLSTALLDAYPYPAGLPNAVLLAPLDDIGGLAPPAVRLYNFFLLAAVIGLVAWLSRPGGGGFGWAGMTLGNPVAWVLFGLALTEPLAMVGTTVAVAALRLGSLGLAVTGGLAFGVAVLCRPHLLVLVPVLPLFALCRPGGWWRAAVCLTAAGSVCLPVFAYWRGLVSPAVLTDNYANQQLSAVNGLLACGYAGVMALLVTPRWFQMSPRAARLTLALAVVAAVVGGWAGIKQQPLASVAERWLPAALASVYPTLMGGLLCAGAVVFLAASALRLAELRHHSLTGFAAASGFVILVLSCVKIAHQFSSRYVAVGLPLLLIAAAPYRSRGWGETTRLVAGAVVGIAMLRTYLR